MYKCVICNGEGVHFDSVASRLANSVNERLSLEEIATNKSIAIYLVASLTLVLLHMGSSKTFRWLVCL